MTSVLQNGQADLAMRRNQDHTLDGVLTNRSVARRFMDHSGTTDLDTSARPNRAPPPTPPASELRDSIDSEETISGLATSPQQQQARRLELETELGSKEQEIDRLRKEIATANAEQHQAILDDDTEKTARFKRQVAALNRLLREAREREEELENALSDVKRRLREARAMNADIQGAREARETREEQDQIEGLVPAETILANDTRSLASQRSQTPVANNDASGRPSRRRRSVKSVSVPRGEFLTMLPI